MSDRERIGIRVLDTIDWLLNGALRIVLFVVLGICIFSLYDTYKIYNDAAPDNMYSRYRPLADGSSGLSFGELKEQNPDVVAWLTLDDTNIDYPVVKGSDNSYYLNRDALGEYSLSGSIFMDYRMASDFSSPYSIIYGHNVRDGSMLSDLALLKDQKLYDEEPYFWILTPKGNYRYQIFSIFQCHRSADVFQRSFDCWGEDFSKWQSELKLRNSMQGDVKLKEYGHVVVFSTCVPNSFDRTIVCGTYIDGDSIPDPSGKNK